ncbi:unnamed protein product [Soboliphyme baturini]|uniref:Secreted protein n=1 Tax=Soboliphyme baturini TaxID=241478 RepID=A0A183IS46_9BILA|nr:unnamed protein product [Soboliphyme baturini]
MAFSGRSRRCALSISVTWRTADRPDGFLLAADGRCSNERKAAARTASISPASNGDGVFYWTTAGGRNVCRLLPPNSWQKIDQGREDVSEAAFNADRCSVDDRRPPYVVRQTP